MLGPIHLNEIRTSTPNSQGAALFSNENWQNRLITAPLQLIVPPAIHKPTVLLVHRLETDSAAASTTFVLQRGRTRGIAHENFFTT
jgi:hypothetical protein